MNVKFLLAAIFCANILSCYAYNFGSYKVISANDSSSVEYACIANRAKTFSIMSDSLGWFSLPSELSENDSISIFRIGYVAKQFRISELPNIISLDESPTSLMDVVVTPRKTKTLGDIVVPNKFQRSLIDFRHKVNPIAKAHSRFNKEAGRKFKIKNDFILRKIRVAISNELPLDFVFIIYHKIDSEWVAIHNQPIVAKVAESHKDPFVVELDVTELLEPQPKGEYLVSIMTDDRLSIWGKSPWLEDGYQRSPLDDAWETKDIVPGIEVQIEY